MRFVVAFVSVMVGIVAGTAELLLCFLIEPAAFQAVAKKDMEGMGITTGVCATGFAVAYAVGRFLYQRVDAPIEAAQLQQFAKGHLAVLHLLAAGYLLVAIILGIRGGEWLTAPLVIGCCLVVLTAWELFRVWRKQRRRSSIAKQP